MPQRVTRGLLACLALALLAPPARAHPVPKNNHDRTVQITLTPEAVLVDYQLEVDEARAALDMTEDAIVGVGSRKEFYVAYTRFMAPVLAHNLDAKLGGKALSFTCARQRFEVTDHIQCRYQFRAEWKPEAGRDLAFSFRESNFADDDFSALRVMLAVSPRLTTKAVVSPDEALMSKPGDKRAPGEGDRLRLASATFVAEPSAEPGCAKPGSPLDPGEPRRPPRRKQMVGRGKPRLAGAGPWARPVGAGGKAGLATVKPTYAPAEAPASAEVEGEVHSRDSRLLHLLYNTHEGMALLLGLAAVFGAAHALTPGHGKAMVAAYLVGERGTMTHALVLGLVVTLTHTAAVMVLAALLPLLYPESARSGLTDAERAEVARVLGLVCGLLIAGLGFWLLLQRLSGRADHIHLAGGHSHGHGHSHGGSSPARPGWWGLVTLGVSGGIVPCWDALLMLLSPVALARPWLALPLVLAFSGGLAATLVALGVAVVYAHRKAADRWGESARLQRVARLLPIATAALITGLGLWMCFDSVRPGP
jgi:nickel/cobalt exporter